MENKTAEIVIPGVRKADLSEAVLTQINTLARVEVNDVEGGVHIVVSGLREANQRSVQRLLTELDPASVEDEATEDFSLHILQDSFESAGFVVQERTAGYKTIDIARTEVTFYRRGEQFFGCFQLPEEESRLVRDAIVSDIERVLDGSASISMRNQTGVDTMAGTTQKKRFDFELIPLHDALKVL